MRWPTPFFSLLLLILFASTATAQDKPKDVWDSSTFDGLKFRSIGPALMAGRIADIAIHPTKENTWYVAVGSGGVWKTANAGITWTPLFDKQSVFSTGCVTIDPNNPHTIWVGTGENVGGRHVGFGDGIYRSPDGGKSWENLGLKNSEHISKIVVHPDHSNVVWVAVQGPLWNKGGERGIYKTVDGGKNWKRTLGDDVWVGATDIQIDPRNPDLLYAATWQRHRTVAAYMGGGPGTGLHRSLDGGETWQKLSKGLPESNMGKIGLAISPQQPDILYAAIELDRRTGAVYKSIDRGASWTEQSKTVSGATGPHYYQELYASPHHFDKIILMDVRMQVSNDGGKTFKRMKEEHKHSDNHSIAFKKSDPDYMLIGTDGGIYETLDNADNWRFIDNMPLTQFYKLALDDAEPFYNIYGGTQDNSTEGGPSRTDKVQGIQNSDWRVVLNWDGHQPATEPGNPDIMYGQRQEGTLSRIDLKTGEVIDIQPQPDENEPYERYNWDAPILVSPHAPATIFFASQRLWRSTDRGDNWTALSPDLTRNQNRFDLPIMGRKQSWDNAWDVLAMSNYNTITSIAQSPKQKDLIYIGTDDGLIQITEDGGANWRKIETSSISGLPGTCYINNIVADLFDENTVYVAMDNHKYGDFSPYLIKSTDRGKTWTSIKSNLPDKHLVWRLVQDHVKKDLLFAATELGIFFTVDGGKKWIELNGGIPTISFRDIAIQRRENDLVGASFGRSFYVLDDYSALREVSNEQLNEAAGLFPVRKAWWYIPKSHLGFDGKKGDQGASHYVADNPPFGAEFTYYVKEDIKTSKAIRQEKEKAATKNNQDINFPGWETLQSEKLATEPSLVFTIKDADGNVVRRLTAPAKKGFHRIAWDLRYPSPDLIRLWQKRSNDDGPNSGLLAPPGTYSVSMAKKVDGTTTPIGGEQTFEVVPLTEGALPGADVATTMAFYRKYEQVTRDASRAQSALNRSIARAAAMQQALQSSRVNDVNLDSKIYSLHQSLTSLNAEINGNPATQEPGEKTKPSLGERLFAVSRGLSNSTYGPTTMHKRTLTIAEAQLAKLNAQLEEAKGELAKLQKEMIAAGAPWVEE